MCETRRRRFSNGPLRPLGFGLHLFAIFRLLSFIPSTADSADRPLPAQVWQVEWRGRRLVLHRAYFGSLLFVMRNWTCDIRPWLAISSQAILDLLCPTSAKNSWRWQTSNSEYGKFHVSMNREFAKSQEAHKDCSRTCDNLSEELKLAKCQLEKMKITCGQSLCDPVGNQPLSCKAWPTSPRLGKCECPVKPGPPSSDMYVTEHMNQFNGAQRHYPQMLVDHIIDCHPHLVKRVTPKLPLSKLKYGIDTGDKDDDNAGCCPDKMMCGFGGSSRSASGSGSQSPRSVGCGPSKGKRKVNMKPGKPPKKQRGTIYEAVSDLKHTAAGGANLPPTQRYDFYRHFGYAGQGAKTSKGWHTIKAPWTDMPRL